MVRGDTVLVVDDVSEYCEELAFTLSHEGYDVRWATNPSEAIAIGCVFRPKVLVTDWMLQENMNGLDVAATLRMVNPELQTVLISGFVSSDLRKDAKGAQVYDFLEKPFPLQRMKNVVKGASGSRTLGPPIAYFGFVEIDSGGKIIYVNSVANDMFAQACGGRSPSTAEDLFGPVGVEKLNQSFSDWTKIGRKGSSEVDETGGWHVRGREIPGRGGVYVLLDDKHSAFTVSRAVHQLLALPEGKHLLDGKHVLVVDDHDTVRRMTVELLRQLKWFCHSADSHAEAIRIFAHDPDVAVIIVDYEMPAEDVTELIGRMQVLRPAAQIIGTSSASHRDDFARLGVTKFLGKPWSLEDLLEVMKPTGTG